MECAVSSRGMLGIQLSMHCTAEGELFCSIYLLTLRTFEGLRDRRLPLFTRLACDIRRTLRATCNLALPSRRPGRAHHRLDRHVGP